MTATEPPLCAEPEFAALVDELVANWAPRLFALVEETAMRVEGRIVAWGMAFEDHAEVIGVCRSIRGRFQSAESAHQLFSHSANLRLVWYNPAAASPDHEAS